MAPSGRQTDGQTDRRADGQTGGYIDRWAGTDRLICAALLDAQSMDAPSRGSSVQDCQHFALFQDARSMRWINDGPSVQPIRPNYSRSGRDGTGQDRTGQDRTGQDRAGHARQASTGWRRQAGVDRLASTGWYPQAGIHRLVSKTGIDWSGQTGFVRTGFVRTGSVLFFFLYLCALL